MQELDQIIEVLETYKGRNLCIICNEWQAIFSKTNVYTYKIIEGLNKFDRRLVVYEDGKEFFCLNEKWFELPTEETLEALMKKSKDTIVGCAWRLISGPVEVTDILLIQCFRVRDIYMLMQKANNELFCLQDYWRGMAMLVSNPSIVK